MAAMACGANFARANSSVFGGNVRVKDMPLVYDVCHNIAKFETYRDVGQPVLLPGEGRYSFVLVGAQGPMGQSFGVCCHGAGRRQSRTAAQKSISPRDLLDQLAVRHVTMRVHSKNLLAEEAPAACKDTATPIQVSFFLAYGNNNDRCQRAAVAVIVHAFKLLLKGTKEEVLSNSKEKIPLQRLDPFRWQIPASYQEGMHVPGIVYADDELIQQILDDHALHQVANLAILPGIVGASLGMSDIHWGYGFPVGGVAATDAETGVVSPGGIGFDSNCGVRLMATELERDQMKGQIDKLAAALFNKLPSGVGDARMRELTIHEMRAVMVQGAAWAVEDGYGFAEEGGSLAGADPDKVSPMAVQRGMKQVGCLGSGNHFAEVQYVEHIYDQHAAEAMGIGQVGQIVVTIHCGSRGFGYQIAEEYIKLAEVKQAGYGFNLPDRQLACLPLQSDEGKAYMVAMACGANFAWANRQLLMRGVRRAFSSMFGRKARAKDKPLVYDVCHNIAKFEEYEVDEQLRRVCVHRKGATRAFPAGHPALPEKYRAVGQPVLIPGDMGCYSFMLVGAPGSLEQRFGSCCHRAGRRQSRTAAKKSISPRELLDQLAARGMTIRFHNKNLLSEEAPAAYKDTTTPIRMSFSLDYGNERDSRKRSAVAVTVHAFNIF
jgi:tRNA-splicing ligase RtcB